MDNYNNMNEIAVNIDNKIDVKTINISEMDSGPIFMGIGMTVETSCRLLRDYPDEQLNEIIEILFKPNYAASLHHLKLEIGSDVNSSSGTVPCHMRSREDYEHRDNWLLWFAKKAKSVNPKLILSALRWGTPAWIKNYDDKYLFYKRYLEIAREYYGLEFDFLGPDQNEGEFDRDWVVNVLRKRLDEDGFRNVKLIASDAVSNPWLIASEILKDDQLNKAIDIVGAHYTTSSSNDAKDCGKPLWHSEAWPLMRSRIWDEISTGVSGGALGFAKTIIDSFVIGKMVSYIMNPFIEAYYEIVPYNTKGCLVADKPWSGYYYITEGLWITAHFTQFIKPGWKFIESACEANSVFNYITLKSDDDRDFSTIILNTIPSKLTYNFTISGGFSEKTINIWKSNSDVQFSHVVSINPTKGHFEFIAEPYTIYSISTTQGQKKGKPKKKNHMNANLSLPYFDDFEEYNIGSVPNYACDQGGAFQVTEDKPKGGKILKQVITNKIKPIDWVYRKTPEPYTIIGDLEWANYIVSCDIFIDEADGYVFLAGRVIDSPYNEKPPLSYNLRLFKDGKWELRKWEKVLLCGQIEKLNGDIWHNLKLKFLYNTINAYIDNIKVAKYVDDIGSISSGAVALGCGYHFAYFDNILIEKVDKNTPPFVKRIDNADPSIIYEGTWQHDNGASYSHFRRTLSKCLCNANEVYDGNSYVGRNSNSFNTVKYTFYGTGINIVGVLDKDNPIEMDIYIDEEFYKTIKLHDSESENSYKRTLFSVVGLVKKLHTIKVIVRSSLHIDYLEIYE